MGCTVRAQALRFRRRIADVKRPRHMKALLSTRPFLSAVVQSCADCL
jgi:hypothetical protein